MFGKSTVKNRRLTAKEFADDLEDSKIWDRYPRTYLYEKHYYKHIIPEPVVNFSLNYHF